ncbi:MAG TPA: tocopherol cyclase family protein [bacterium]|nr:tocopherol cyclase family protein [bacterium]HQG46513.1 tocopherol cyclase family protein [bacterium]HQI48520.1 tocopherol cyclase family protein [bacterium]HQJ64063.1 tocopherol cyclase family protein [bacterium]
MIAIRSLLHLEGYHGEKKKAPFFEGWYYKCVDGAGENRLALIPGIARHREPEQDHAFLQILDGSSGRSFYHRVPAEQFHADPRGLEQHVGACCFSQNGLALDIEAEGWQLKGEITFGPLSPWPVTLRSPGAMGWYAWVPFMECYHGVVSFSHELKGTVLFNGRGIDFAGGRGYIEKDWGRSFPHAYIWLQSNHFPAAETSFMASVAIIPWLRSAFPGFIIGLHHRHHLYRFATYTGAQVEALEIGDAEILLQVRDRHHRLHIRAERARAGLLHAPTPQGMKGRIAETLGGTLSLRLDRLESRERIMEQTGLHAGIEAAGDLPALLALLRRGLKG